MYMCRNHQYNSLYYKYSKKLKKKHSMYQSDHGHDGHNVPGTELNPWAFSLFTSSKFVRNIYSFKSV